VFNTLLEELPQQPSIVQTDNGGEFSSSFDKLLLAEHITHMRSKPGHPQTNGAVERLNRTLSDKLEERYANKAASGLPWNLIHDLRQIVETTTEPCIGSQTRHQLIYLLKQTLKY
jgi:transposase InsO family protein